MKKGIAPVETLKNNQWFMLVIGVFNCFIKEIAVYS